MPSLPNISTPPRPSKYNGGELSTCKICRFGVYQGQQWKWSRQPIGIVHTECLEPKP
jgi:hypothetical protein